ncbi:DUF551 domain-containing protein, partial [Klebsiella quasipneumoniae]
DERITSVIERLEHYASNLKWTNVRGAQDLLTAADGLRELQERSKPLQDKDLQGVIDALEHPAGINTAGKQVVRLAMVELQERRKADSEPVAWTWHYREQWYVTSDKRRAAFVAKDGDVAVLPLYRHAQPVPVVPKEMTAGIAVKHWEGGRGSIESFVAGYNFCRATMLQASPVCTCPSGDGSLRWPCQVHPGSSPVIPDGYVMVPKEPTREILDEFDSIIDYGAEDSEDAWRRLLAAAPQLPGSDPATVPGKWIPVSERIPDNTEPVLCIEKRADFGTYGQPFVCWHDGGGWVGKTNYRPIVTHWMPLPADPEEVK